MNSSKPFISIIIPVFNVEKYIEQCLKSIITQDFKDIEVIIINDGSTDASAEICNFFASQDNRLTVIHQKNMGPSGARNSGIRAAKGDYILFIDSDDFIGNVIHKIAKKLQDINCVDVMFLEAFKYFNGKTTSLGDGLTQASIDNQPRKKVLNHLSTRPKYPGSACTKIVSRKFIIENSLYFPNGLFSEDLFWVADILLKAKTFAYCEFPYYFYRQNRKNSITKTFNEYKFSCIFKFINKYSNNCANNVDNEYEWCMRNFAAYEYMIAIILFSYLNKAEKAKYKKEMVSLSYLLGYRNDRKSIATKILYNVLGLNLSSFLLSRLIKLRNIL